MPTNDDPNLCGSPQTTARTTSNLPHRSTGRRVLIVDDEPSIRDVMSRILRRQGHAVEVAANGAGALALARAGAFDLIICDLNLPGTSGLDIYAELVRERLLGGALFALATGEAGASASPEVVGFGGLPLLAKPFELAGLIDLVGRVPTVRAGRSAA